MADIVDLAAEHMEQEEALRERARAAKPPVEYGPAECAECEESMPEVRRAYGCLRCVECQEKAEKFLARGLSLSKD